MAADGTDARPLAQGQAPFWSPDGHRIAFTGVPAMGPGQISVMNVDGSGLVRLTNLPYGARGAQWSPDGRRIVFTASLDLNYPSPERPPWHDVFLINPDGSDLLNLTKGRADYVGPRWSPDGSRIAFTTYADIQQLNPEVGVMNRDGTGEMNLTRNPAGDFDPNWSPDGTAILFTRSTEAYVMRSDGSNQIDVSNGPASELSWSPF
jgi:TolB protein